MKFRMKQFFTSVLAAVLVATNVVAPGGPSIVAKAVEQSTPGLTVKGTNDEKKVTLVGTFPVGAILRSDSFGGLRVLYNGKDSYTISRGSNKVALTISVIDEKLASGSLQYLYKLFGPVNVQVKKGSAYNISCILNGIGSAEYENLVLSTKDESLSIFLKPFIEQAKKEDKERALYAKFYESIVEAQRAQNEEIRNNAQTEPGDGNSDSEDSDKADDKSDELYTRTILIYLDGTNLETDSGYGTKNLLDMLRAKIPDNVKVIVVAGGTKTWHMNDPKTYYEYAGKLLYPDVDEDKLTTEQKKEVKEKAAEFKEKYGIDISGLQTYEVVSNNGINSLKLLKTYDNNQYIVDKDFFISAIDFTTDYAPASKYDLVIWDHGGGPGGYGEDEFLADYLEEHKELKETIENTVTLKRISEILAGSSYIKNGGKFDFIGFDACQMGNYEVASTVAPYAEYYIGSEENEPGYGWDYNVFFNTLGANPMVSTIDLGSAIIDGFINQYKKGNSTLSMVDLGKMKTLDEKVAKFAVCLMKEADTRYYDMVASVGTRSHFATREGYGSSNLLDLRRLATAFTNESKEYSTELVSASNEVIQALDDCVLVNKYKETFLQNGGMSIYYPIRAYYERPAKIEKGSYYYNNRAQELLKIYADNGINEEYRLAAAKLAVRNLAGLKLVNFWNQSADPTVKDLFTDYINKDENDRYVATASGIDINNPDDPIVKSIGGIIADRLSADKVTVVLPNRKDNDEYKDYEGDATVIIKGSNSLAVGDRMDIKITLNVGTDEQPQWVSVGNKNGYSDEKEVGENDEISYKVKAFDQIWYSLNGQIVSLYITDVLDDGNIVGYIPLGNWCTEEAASGIDAGDQTRTEYIIDQATKGYISTIRMYIRSYCTTNDAGEEEWNYEPIRYNDFEDGEEKNSHDMSELTYRYLEILGGADNFYSISESPDVYSLGTVYINKSSELNVQSTYTSGLFADYYLSDVYGNEYVVSASSLNNEGETGKKGLEDFYDYIPEDSEKDALTWEKSQQEAEKVRQEAIKCVEEDRQREASKKESGVVNAQLDNKSVEAEDEPVADKQGTSVINDVETDEGTEDAKKVGDESTSDIVEKTTTEIEVSSDEETKAEIEAATDEESGTGKENAADNKTESEVVDENTAESDDKEVPEIVNSVNAELTVETVAESKDAAETTNDSDTEVITEEKENVNNAIVLDDENNGDLEKAEETADEASKETTKETSEEDDSVDEDAANPDESKENEENAEDVNSDAEGEENENA